jgi:hypothetical protein
MYLTDEDISEIGFVGSVGGILGLFTGFSFVSVIEIIYVFLVDGRGEKMRSDGRRRSSVMPVKPAVSKVSVFSQNDLLYSM